MDKGIMVITVRELMEGYVNNGEMGIFAYGGKLNVRPPYQRELVYEGKDKEDVIRTILDELPISMMYWAKNDDGTFEIIDGQQRTMSICEYCSGDFSVDYKFIGNDESIRNKILDYKLYIHIFEGDTDNKLKWFERVNTVGKKLTVQELRNAAYTGPWLTDAKRHFSKTGCPAYEISKDLVKGVAIRQEILETALIWVIDRENMKDVRDYMANHQNDEDANELWIYFQDVIAWVRRTFPNIRKEMKGLPWGILYNKYKDKSLNSKKLEEEISRLMKDDDVTKKSGIYEYLLSGNEKYLSIRAFTESQKAQKYEEQKGICPHCKKEFKREDMEADHIKPWSEGGKTELDNCQMLCRDCNRTKSNN